MSLFRGVTQITVQLFVLLTLIPVSSACADQESAPPISNAIAIGQQVDFTSEILGETRQLQVRLPGYYDEDSSRYPVLLVLDGGNYFNYLVSILDMIAPNHLPEMIVVGLPNTDRSRDLDPTDASMGEPGAGVDRFHRFLAEELFPYLEQNYRASSYRILAGHSLAGLNVLHTFLQAPEMFQAYLASSPAIYSEGRHEIVQRGLAAVDPAEVAGRFVFISAGGQERPELIAAVEQFGKDLTDRESPDLQVNWRIYPAEGHVPIKGFYEALRLLFPSWFPRDEFIALDLPAVEKHYDSLGNRYLFPVKPPYGILGSMARRAERGNMPELALASYRAQLAAYPKEQKPREKLAELAVQGLTGPYLGQPTPGLIPRSFADFLAPATDNKHSQLAWSPDGKKLYYSVYPNNDYPQKIMVTQQQGNGWTPPRVAEFSGNHQEGGPVFSPDGKRLYFYSKRPLPGSEEPNENSEAWFVESLGEKWSDPVLVGKPINSEHGDHVNGFLPSGDMILARYIDRKMCLYRSSPAMGGWSEPELLKRVFDGEEFFQATDMGEDDFFIFTVNKKIWGPWYNAYLYISFRNEDGSWTAPRNMGDMINRGEGRFPSFSPDGKYLFFTSYRSGQAGHYWVDAAVIDYLRDNDLSLVAQLTEIVKKEGVAAARLRAAELRGQHQEYYRFDELLFDDVADELIMVGLADLAISVLELNQELYPDEGSLLRRIKLATLSENRTTMSAMQSELAMGEGPGEAELNGWGRFFVRAGHQRGAILIFELNLAIHPHSAGALAGLAAAHHELGELEKASDNLEKALQIDPDNWHAKQVQEELAGGN